MTAVKDVIVTVVPRGARGTFTIKAPKSGKSYSCVCAGFCPVEEGDIVSGDCEEKNGVLHFHKVPTVIVPDTQEAIVRYLTSFPLKLFPLPKLNNFYAALAQLASASFPSSADGKQVNVQENICRYLDNKAYEYTHDHTVVKELKSLTNITTVTNVEKLLAHVHKHRNRRRLWLLGLKDRDINSCHMPEPDIYRTIIHKPHGVLTLYSLDIDKCRAILDHLGFTVTPEDALCAAVVRILHSNVKNKAYAGTPSNLLHKMLGPGTDMSRLLPRLKEEYGVVLDMGTYYLQQQHRVEKETAQFIHDLLRKPPLTTSMAELKFEAKFTQEQRSAVLTMYNNWISCLQAPAGCGKTLSISQFIANLDSYKKKYYMCTFTARAAERLTELTGKPAYTIHRLISMLNKRGESKKEEKIDYIINDEVSMLPVPLFYRLFTTILKLGHTPQWVFVGDKNQLPTISWGNLMTELLKIKELPFSQLSKNHRITEGNNDGISAAANVVIGESKATVDTDYDFDDDDITVSDATTMSFKETDNFRILDGGIDVVYELLSLLYKSGIKQNRITIITPFNNNDIQALNKKFQDIFNESGQKIKDIKGREWIVGSRIMCTRNNYELGIFNGTQGTIMAVDEKNLCVQFKGVMHQFPFPQPGDPVKEEAKSGSDDDPEFEGDIGVDQLVISYALTTHKIQGGENDIIIVWLPPSKDSGFLNKNLIYTAFTRARASLFVVGDRNTLMRAIQRKPKYRCDNLCARIRALLDAGK